MPQQNSITSSPRVTSPIASDSTLPCSAVRYLAISSRRSCTSSRIANRISARFAIESARHAGNAAFAAWTARSTSSAVAKSTAPDCWPVAGLNTGPLRPDVPAYGAPEIQWLIGLTAAGASRTSVTVSLLGKLDWETSAVEPTVAELAEDAAAHVLPRPGFETIHRDEFFFEAGQAPRLAAAAAARRRRGDRRVGARAVRAPRDHALRMVGRLERDADRPRRAARRPRLRPGRRGGDAHRDEHRARAAGRAARRRAADRDARAAPRSARGQLGRLGAARRGASLAPRVRARALRSAGHGAPLRRVRERPTRRLRPRDRHGRRRRADGRRRRCRQRAAAASTARSCTRAGSTPSRAARRSSSCRRAACRRRCSTGLGFQSHGVLRLFVDPASRWRARSSSILRAALEHGRALHAREPDRLLEYLAAPRRRARRPRARGRSSVVNHGRSMKYPVVHRALPRALRRSDRLVVAAVERSRAAPAPTSTQAAVSQSSSGRSPRPRRGSPPPPRDDRARAARARAAPRGSSESRAPRAHRGRPSSPVDPLRGLEIAGEVQPEPAVLALRARAVLVAALDQSGLVVGEQPHRLVGASLGTWRRPRARRARCRRSARVGRARPAARARTSRTRPSGVAVHQRGADVSRTHGLQHRHPCLAGVVPSRARGLQLIRGPPLPEEKPRERVVALRVDERRSVAEIGEPRANVLLEAGDRLTLDRVVTAAEAAREERDRRVVAFPRLDRFRQHASDSANSPSGVQGDAEPRQRRAALRRACVEQLDGAGEQATARARNRRGTRRAGRRP